MRQRDRQQQATKFSEAEATQRYKTALGRALVYNLEQGIDWKLDEHGRLLPIPKSFVSEPSNGAGVTPSQS